MAQHALACQRRLQPLMRNGMQIFTTALSIWLPRPCLHRIVPTLCWCTCRFVSLEQDRARISDRSDSLIMYVHRWIWMFWVSPLQYAITGLANNEFGGDSYDVTEYRGQITLGQPLGEEALEVFGFNTGTKWRCGTAIGARASQPCHHGAAIRRFAACSAATNDPPATAFALVVNPAAVTCPAPSPSTNQPCSLYFPAALWQLGCGADPSPHSSCNPETAGLTVRGMQERAARSRRWLAVIVLLGCYVIANLFSMVAFTFLPPPSQPPPAPPPEEPEYVLSDGADGAAPAASPDGRNDSAPSEPPAEAVVEMRASQVRRAPAFLLRACED